MADTPAFKDAPWPATAPPARALDADASADVCVVGAGIAGLCVAYTLSKRGRSVVVLDDGPVAGGETRRSTAHLASALDDRIYHLEWVHGEEGARRAAASHAAAIDWIESVVVAESIECGFRRVDGYLVVPPRRLGEREALLDRELEAARRAGLPVDRVSAPPLGGALWGGALRFRGQGQMDPAAFAAGLAAAITGAGGRIHTPSHVTTISGGEPWRVETREGPAVSAAHVVVATNSPVNDRVVMHTKQASYRTYAVAFPDLAGEFPAMLLWDGKWEDDRAYHYVRRALLPARPGEPATPHVIVGGEDHKTGQDGESGTDRFERLAAWARARFAGLGDPTCRWSGQVLEPCDGVAFIGRNPADDAGVYIVTGDSGQGITHAAIAGMLIPDLIDGRDHPWASLYDPARKSLRAVGALVRENVNAAAQYADWLVPGAAQSEDEIRRGSGAVILRGLRRIAVHRDDDGVVWRCSATCPHLGGVVRWNAAERTWDCPCHGSRFDTRGRVLNGPANQNLGPPGASTSAGRATASGRDSAA